MSRVLVTANAFVVSGEAAAAPLREAGLEVVHAPRMGPLAEEEALAALQQSGAGLVIASADAYTDRVMAGAPALRGIVRWGVGVDAIDLEAATTRGVVVANTPGTNTQAVADYVLGLMLVLARPLCEGRVKLASGGWYELRGVELYRKTLGIVGFGAIGQAVARRARGFDMRLLAYDPHVSDDAFARAGADRATLTDLLRQADLVTLHAALTPESRGMLGAAELGLMKPGAYLINAARGGLLDEDALIRALDEGRLGGAGLDCFATEPLPAEHPLRRHPRCFGTPHNAFNTVETAERTNRLVAEAVIDLYSGRRPRFVVNPEVYGE